MSYHVNAPGVNHAWRVLLDGILRYGAEISPRGMLTKELNGVCVTIENSRANTLISTHRKLSHKYLVAEWLWIMFGRNDVDTIVPFNKHLLAFSDDHERFAGAYGPMIQEQWSYVKQLLRDDPATRQAVMTIWRPKPRQSKDIPCTVALQFLIRDGKLNMITTMRSNDAWLGFPYDVFTFTQLQNMLALQLGYAPGWYQHNVGSMHLYEQHFTPAKMCINEFTSRPADDIRQLYVLECGNQSSDVPPDLESVFMTIARDRVEGRKFTPDDAREIADAVDPAGVGEWTTFIAALMGVQQGRFLDIRNLEARL